jgi:hypothetical protein
MTDMNRSIRSLLLGLGLDCKDGHTRITKGRNFRLYGGSRETHEMMQDKAMRLNGELDKRGKSLDSITPDEFCEIANKVGLKVLDKKEG